MQQANRAECCRCGGDRAGEAGALLRTWVSVGKRRLFRTVESGSGSQYNNSAADAYYASPDTVRDVAAPGREGIFNVSGAHERHAAFEFLQNAFVPCCCGRYGASWDDARDLLCDENYDVSRLPRLRGDVTRMWTAGVLREAAVHTRDGYSYNCGERGRLRERVGRSSRPPVSLVGRHRWVTGPFGAQPQVSAA